MAGETTKTLDTLEKIGEDGVALSPEPSPSSVFREEKKETDERRVVFCPVNNNSNDLARLRLHPCIGFSDSMPLSRDPSIASTLVVAFVVWQVEASELAGVVSDWHSRMAEINHTPANCRPMSVILSFAVEKPQEQQLQQFADLQKGKLNQVRFIDDDSPDTIMEALQDLAQAAIERAKEGPPQALPEKSPPAKSRGCSIM
eukprot:CAMPEP_0206465558 /NCGR_PEP_ID=MMETSP0324_2-20121206/27906_1 /ASSEMBLY_ACC=CAM_ASM_000836 /TAXON_ID=2866 /ORGANISM="Crypthecodinium cohnii, Strain Seligo" /LENGTH=200 /DNA_ID=CAMNT_0053938449 /DNA_START=268 /DNA_END=870 /DNA_ORIENTATION=-